MKMQLQFVFQHVITETTTSCNGNVPVVCLSKLSQKRQQVAMNRNDNKLQCSCSLSSNMLSQKRQQVAMKMQLQFVFQHVITETTTSCNENVVVVCLPTRNHQNDNALHQKGSCSLSSNMLSQKRQQVAMKMQLQFVFQHVITETTTSCNENVVVVCLPTCYHRNDNELQ